MAREAAKQRLVQKLHKLREVSSSARTTETYKDLAKSVVDLREWHTHNGLVDYRGRSRAYISDYNEALSESGLSAEDAATVRKRTQYHISGELRRRLSPDQLSTYGLDRDSYRDRARARKAIYDGVSLLTRSALSGEDGHTVDPRQLARFAEAFLDRVVEITELGPNERRELESRLVKIRERVEELLAELAK